MTAVFGQEMMGKLVKLRVFIHGLKGVRKKEKIFIYFFLLELSMQFYFF
jgi:hypothetical protein